MRLALLLLLSPSALAFHAYPKGGPHDKATRRAAEATELDSSALSALKQAVRQLDVDELAVDLRATGNPRAMRGPAAEVLLHPRCDFEGSHHFQRGPDQAIDDVLTHGQGVLKRARIDAISALADGDRDRAVHALAQGLHALQDFFAHSNVVFLDEHRQALIVDWVLGRGGLPEEHGIELVVYRPCEEPPGELPGSAEEAAALCTHDAQSALCASVASPRSLKGSSKDPLGHRAYDRALGFATDASITWMQLLKREARTDWEVLQ